MRTAGWVLAALLSATACSPGSDESIHGPTVAVRDSSGVRLVDNSGPTKSLAVVETLRIGVIEGDPAYLFNRVAGVAIDGSGSLWVSDSDESIRSYSRDGRYLGSAGGSGEGPGESPNGYGEIWAGVDEVFVLAYTPMLQLFSLEGDFLGGWSPWRSTDLAQVFPLGSAHSAWFYVRTDFPEDETSSGRERWTIVKGSATTPDGESLVELPGAPRVPGLGGGWSSGSFFDGFPSVAAGDGSVFYSDPQDYVVRRFNDQGMLEGVLRREVDRVPLPRGLPAEVEAALPPAYEETRIRLEGEAHRSMVEAVLPDSDPEWIPAIDLVLVSRDGALWVRRADAHPDPTQRAIARAFGYVPNAWLEAWKADWVFDVFSPEGTYRGSVTLPEDFVPMAVESSRVYGVMRDELDVEYVVAFDLVGEN